MRVIRRTSVEINAKDVAIGDDIAFTLEGFGVFTATAQKIEDDCILFMFTDCVAKMPMNELWTNEGGFDASNLKKWMNTNLFDAFPEGMRRRMSGLTIPSYGMMFGHDDWYENFEPDEDEQLPLMKKCKNRIADLEDDYCWYWLSNAAKKQVSPALFAGVGVHGYASYSNAGGSYGVRPIFWLSK